MQQIDISPQQAELKTTNSPRRKPQSKLSAKWEVVEGKLVCFGRLKKHLITITKERIL